MLPNCGNQTTYQICSDKEEGNEDGPLHFGESQRRHFEEKERKESMCVVWCVMCGRNGLFNELAFTRVLRECVWKEPEGERRRKNRVG